MAGVVVVGAIVLAGWFSYAYGGLLFDPSYPVLALLLLVATATTVIYRRVEQQRGEVRRAFSYYVTPALVDEIIADPDKLELGGEVRDLTILFCDVRNFTAISERLSAQELTHFINSLLTPLSDVILANRGTIDKYMGDAIMAFWKAPLSDPDHAINAYKAAMTMIDRIKGLNEEWRAEAEAAGRPHSRVAIGIGINTGDCLVGNLGSLQRFDYSAIGDGVNVASRYEGLSKVYGVPIVIGETTTERIPDLRRIELDIMRVKGRTEPTRIYTPFDLFSADGSSFDQIASCHGQMLEAYRRSDWDGAEAAIKDCEDNEVEGLKALYGVYRGRISGYRQDPPPADWDGTFTATTK